MNTMGIVYVAIGLTLGAVIGWLLARQKLSGEVIRKEERIKAKEEAIATSELRVKAEIQNLAAGAPASQPQGAHPAEA